MSARSERRGTTTALVRLALVGWVLPVALAEQLPQTLYTTADGLSHEYVQRIVRDSRGFLWFCTLDGLSRFDGQTFVNYDVRDGLPHANVNDLVESRHGHYWVATSGGLSRFTPATNSRAGGRLFANLRVAERDTDNRVSTLYEDHAGNLWVGTWTGVLRLVSGRETFERVPLNIQGHAEETIEVQAFAGDAEGSLWIGTNHGLVRRLPDGRSQHYTVQPAEEMDYIWTLLCDRRGRIWVGHYGSGLLVLAPEPAARAEPRRISLERAPRGSDPASGGTRLPETAGEARWFGTRDGLADATVRALHEATDGRVWIGSRSGQLTVFDGTRFASYTHGLTRRTTALGEDAAGNLWVGARSGGTLRIARWGFHTFRTEDGLAMDDVNAIYADRDGVLTAVNNGWSLNQYDGTRFCSVLLNLPRAIAESSAGNREIVQDRFGAWWVSTGGGVVRFPAVARFDELATVRPTVYTTADGLAHDNVNRVFVDSRGDVWVASYVPPLTLVRWERATGRWLRYGQAEGIPPDNWPNRITEDHAGNVWFGMHYGGALRWRAGRLEYFGVEAGLPNDVVQGIAIDRHGRLWLGMKGHGAARCDDPAAERPRFTLYTTAQGLGSDIVWSFAEDARGRVYIGHARGVDRLEPESGRIRHLDETDGLSRGEVLTAFCDAEGTLWFGGREGVSRLVPIAEAETSPAPPVYISSIDAVGYAHEIAALGDPRPRGPTLEPHQSQIEVAFYGLSFDLGVPLRYQYKFEGFDRDWSTPSEQRSVAANLAPGSYRFLVRAVNADGAVSPAPAEVSFTILAPVWRRWWFGGLAALTVGALVALGHRAYVARVVEVERVRTRIASDLHDDIGSGLSRVAILSEVLKQRSVANAGHGAPASLLTDIADSARGLVDSMSDIVWSVDPERDDLANVVARARRFAADVFEPLDVHWELTLSPQAERGIGNVKLEPEARRHLYLVLKEAIHNAAKHSGCRRFSLALGLEPRRLTVEIRDDGRGFEWPTGGPPAGNGLRNLRTRLAALGGELRIESAPGRGTRLHLTARLPR